MTRRSASQSADENRALCLRSKSCRSIIGLAKLRAPIASQLPSAPLRTILITVSLLIASNVFMTFAWYAHLRNLSSRPWYVAAFASWGIALFEYLLQVPANRIGFHQLSLAQLKIIQ